jgi:hypothetical protein
MSTSRRCRLTCCIGRDILPAPGSSPGQIAQAPPRIFRAVSISFKKVVGGFSSGGPQEEDGRRKGPGLQGASELT